MINFEETLNKLKNLHNDDSLTDEEGIIRVTKNRAFELPNNYNTTIAFEGDVNSQIIQFSCPKHVEGHDLSKCTYKKLLWINMGSNIEGESNL